MISIIKNNGKSKNINRWSKITVVFFVTVFGLLVVGMGLTNVKEQLYDRYFQRLNDLNTLMNAILVSDYEIRSINIKSYLQTETVSL